MISNVLFERSNFYKTLTPLIPIYKDIKTITYFPYVGFSKTINKL